MRYYKNLIPFLCISLCFYGKLLATGDSVSVLTHRDTIFIEKDSIIGTFFYHTVASKQTLYSLCRFYSLTAEQLQEINPVLKVRTLQAGEQLKVPLSEKLIRMTEVPVARETYAPVYYTVQPGEGLYRIAKNYFSLNTQRIMKLNNLASTELNVGQLLLLGWIPIQAFIKETPHETATKIVKAGESDKVANTGDSEVVDADNSRIMKETVSEAVDKAKTEDAKSSPVNNKIRFDETASKLKKNNSQGVAFWHKELTGTKGIYALHRTAAPNSIIAITNPMFNTTIYAKVVGKIPGNSYPDDVMVVVSPEAATRLGVKDARFFCMVAFFTK